MHGFEAKLAAGWPAKTWQDVTVLLAVSGGADSVALLRAVARLKSGGAGRLIAGHFHHGIRADADADQDFVQRLCKQLEIELCLGQADVREIAERHGDGLEAAARTGRYDFLRQAAEARGARYVITAHSANDQAETILFRVIRGTGLKGLAGIPRTRPLSPAVTLLRPLLDFSRTEIQQYLADLGQDFREDESNRDPQFTRNRIRHSLLPLLEQEYNEQAGDALRRLGQLAGEAQSVIQRQVDEVKAQCVTRPSATSVLLDCRQLHDVSTYVTRELLLAIWQDQGWPQQAMGFEKWQQLEAMVVAESAKAAFPGGVIVEKQDGQLTLTRPV